MENLNEIALRNYGGIVVKSSIDEKAEDVNLAILYQDHGDDFLVIRTGKKIYKYGWFVNRYGYPDYSDLDKEWNKDKFVRNPRLFYEADERCCLSNEMLFWFEDQLEPEYRDGSFWSSRRVRKESYEQVVWRLKYIKEKMKTYADRGITYNADYKKEKLLRYLKANDAMTEETMNIVNSIKWDSRIDGFDGIAGKEETGNLIFGDSIKFIIYNGQKIDPKDYKAKVKSHYDDDEVYDDDVCDDDEVYDDDDVCDQEVFIIDINEFK